MGPRHCVPCPSLVEGETKLGSSSSAHTAVECLHEEQGDLGVHPAGPVTRTVQGGLSRYLHGSCLEAPRDSEGPENCHGPQELCLACLVGSDEWAPICLPSLPSLS